MSYDCHSSSKEMGKADQAENVDAQHLVDSFGRLVQELTGQTKSSIVDQNVRRNVSHAKLTLQSHCTIGCREIQRNNAHVHICARPEFSRELLHRLGTAGH